ncbi:MAG: hypothetical protein WBE63_10525, partial [Acidobacteriaceae bacterium]
QYFPFERPALEVNPTGGVSRAEGTLEILIGGSAADSLRAESFGDAYTSFRYGDPFDSAPGGVVHRWGDLGGAPLRMTFVSCYCVTPAGSRSQP